MKKIFIVFFVLAILMTLTTVVSANGLPEGWCIAEDTTYIPCAGYEELDVYECAYYTDCRWWTQVCIDWHTYTVAVYFDPTVVDDKMLYENPWYPVGGCKSSGCLLINQEQIILYTDGNPAKYTELWYIGSCTGVSWGTEGGNHFSSSLWFNANRDFEWVRYDNKKVKHAFTTNPFIPGFYSATLIGDSPGGYWTLTVP